LSAIGAEKSGKIPGIGGRLPVRSRIARTSAMIAPYPLVREQLLTPFQTHTSRTGDPSNRELAEGAAKHFGVARSLLIQYGFAARPI
jgi:hypothetical protein